MNKKLRKIMSQLCSIGTFKIWLPSAHSIVTARNNLSRFIKIKVVLFVISCAFILLSQGNDQNAITSSLRSYQPFVYHTNMGESCTVHFPTAQVTLPACSPHCSFNAERQAGRLGIPILKLFIQLRWPSGKSARSSSSRLGFDSKSGQTNHFKNWYSQLPCLTLSIKGTVWRTSR